MESAYNSLGQPNTSVMGFIDGIMSRFKPKR
jgi:hypothetical protein